MIFVDTSAWAAQAWREDEDHGRAMGWLGTNRDRLFTTDYIVDELLTLLASKRQKPLAIRVGIELLEGVDLAEVHSVTAEEKLEAWQIFRRYEDKAWSFTDCVSKVVMERLGITTAFTFDHHFAQFGGITIVPG